jgi:GntR family phosphonate transport system transcriptional regulator
VFQNDDRDQKMITRSAGAALWQQIAQSLRDDIISGGVEPGTQLPTESELASRFSVNRHTVRRALSALSNDGYVEATRGRGTFVAEHPIHYPIGTRTRFSEIVSAQDLQPGGRLIASASEKCSEFIAEKLGIAEGDQVTRLEVLRVANGQPVARATSWFVSTLVPNLINDYAETGSITKALERAGFADYKRQSSRISAGLANTDDRKHLRVNLKAPVLLVESVNASGEGKPLQYSCTRFVGDVVQLVVEDT